MIVEQIFFHQKAIETWFENQWRGIEPPFYASVDLRHSGFKLAPVDVNLYPAGFNNLTEEDKATAALSVQTLFRNLDKQYRNILLIVEQHTRNPYYLENIASLVNLLKHAGFNVRISALFATPQTVTTLSGQSLLLEVVTKHHNLLKVDRFVPDCVLLNNDLSEGLPPLLTSVEQRIFPPLSMGWYQRQKSQYFKYYDHLCQQFTDAFDLDSWLMNPFFEACDAIDLSKVSDQTVLIDTAATLLEKISKKYDTYAIQEKPYLIIKANAGTYGMGVLMIEDANDIAHLPRKQRQHMAKTKGNQPIQSVMLQEGVPTLTHCHESVAEPTLYLIGSDVVGGFYRTHAKRSIKESLNTPGMQLVPAPFSMKRSEVSTNDPVLYAYQVVARLATLAAAYEIKASTL